MTRQMQLRRCRAHLGAYLLDQWNEKIDGEIAEVHAEADAEVNKHGGLYGYGMYIMNSKMPIINYAGIS